MKSRYIFTTLAVLLFSLGSQNAQTPTIGLIQQGTNDLPGYVLFNPTNNTQTYLIDKCGYKIREWTSTYNSGHAAYLLPDGSMLRAGYVNGSYFNTGGKGGILQKWDFNGTLTWSYLISDINQNQHHDICPLPNGNVLALVWEKKTVAQATALGRDPALLGFNFWGEKIVEYQPTGLNTANIVWEWHALDHLVQDFDSTKPGYGVVADHPELFNINYTNGSTANDWQHYNGIDYDSVHDQILFSSRQMCEIYVIDHSTTVAEATSHSGGTYGKGGDLLFRWGNPMAYNRGTLADRKLYYQHSPHWIPAGSAWAGNISVFNNGTGRPAGTYSTVDVIAPPVDANWNYAISPTLPFGPDSAFWSYADPVPANLYAATISGAFSLPNGNFLVTDGPDGDLFEIDSNKVKLWEYKNPVNGSGPANQGTSPSGRAVFKASFYDLNYAGLSGQTLTPGAPIELNPYSYSCSMTMLGAEQSQSENEVAVFPNPSGNIFSVKLGNEQAAQYKIYDLNGRIFRTGQSATRNFNLDLSKAENGIYFLEIVQGGSRTVRKLIKE